MNGVLMFKKNKTVIDYSLGIAKENYAKAVADFNSRAKQAYDALERKEYYFIEDKAGGWAVYHRAFYQRKEYETVCVTAKNYENEISRLNQCSIAPRSEYRQIAPLHETLEAAEKALDRRVDPDKYRTFYEATPPLTKFDK